MQEINPDFFIKEINTDIVLQSVTKYCTKCYKELSSSDYIYLNTQTYEYICNECAHSLSEELDSNNDYDTLETNENSLF